MGTDIPTTKAVFEILPGVPSITEYLEGSMGGSARE
jgi:hypothetical protein